MDKAILLEKLRTYQDESFMLYKYYVDATARTFETSTEAFSTFIYDLKVLCENQYDFSWLTENAKTFGANRREFKSLCDDVCALLGNAVEELVRYSNEPILTEPTKFEDYCPFPHAALVMYSGKLDTYEPVLIDGKKYSISDIKLEDTPYYHIYCGCLDF